MIRKIFIAVMAIAFIGFGSALAQPEKPQVPTPVQQASLDQAEAAYDQKDYAAAIQLWTPLAERGVARAQSNLGNLYRAGDGVPEDQLKAVYWYRKAADQGDASGQNELGYAYLSGEGVQTDYLLAAHWLRLSADQGDAGGQAQLSTIYRFGLGVPQDYVQALKWLDLAIWSAKDDAYRLRLIQSRDFLADEMPPAKVSEALALASDFQTELANRGSVPSKSTTDAHNKNSITEYMRTGGVQAGTLGAAIVSVFGALAAALLYRLVRGSWSGTSSTKVRRWAAWGAAWGGFFGISKIAQAILWSNRDDLFQGLFIITVFTPIFVGAGALFAKFLPTRADKAETITETLAPSSNAPRHPEHVVGQGAPEPVLQVSTGTVSNLMSNGGLTDQQMERLEKIASLRDRGILTEQEFAAEKEIILGVTPSRGAT
jgi:hypothetical protein